MKKVNTCININESNKGQHMPRWNCYQNDIHLSGLHKNKIDIGLVYTSQKGRHLFRMDKNQNGSRSGLQQINKGRYRLCTRLKNWLLVGFIPDLQVYTRKLVPSGG